MYGRVYTLNDPDTGEIRYCGKTIKRPDERLKDHLWTAGRKECVHRPVYQWISALHAQGKKPYIFVVEVILLDGMEDWEQIAALNAAEKYWISVYRDLGAELLNGTSGGNGTHGRVVSQETRDKAAASNRGKKRSAETCQRFREAALARPKESFPRGNAHHAKKHPWKFKYPEARIAKIKAAWDSDKRSKHTDIMSTIWSSPQLRAEQSLRHRGERNSNAVLTAETAVAIYNALGSQRAIAKTFGVSRRVVQCVKRGLTWSHVTLTKTGEYNHGGY